MARVPDRGQGTVLAIVVLLFLFLFGPLVVIGLPQTIGADHSFVMVSDSMSPAITSGDVVIVSSVPPEAIQTGDVITFRHDGSRTTHQVVAVGETDAGPVFRTKGIANQKEDPYRVRGDQVIGRVVLVVPWVGQFLLVRATSWLAMALFAVPVFLIVVVRHALDRRGSVGPPDANR